VNARTNAQVSAWERTLPWAMPVLLLLGFALRIAFIGSRGFQTDVSSFEGWTIALLDHGLGAFYTKTGFADYPPGYFYILALVGQIWAPFRAHDASYTLLLVLVKLPAILADLGVGYLIYAIARRFTRPALALGAAALYLLNPATIMDSAVWGQVDSIAGGLALLAVYFLLKSDDRAPSRLGWEIPAAWVTFAYSLLIKPQAAVLLPLFVVFAFTSPERRRMRLAGTAIGVVAAALFTFALVVPFHPTANPFAAAGWLLGRYEFGTSVYPDNSVNAFNLWAIKENFWNLDSARIGFSLLPFLQWPQYVWGIVLVIAALVLVVWRFAADGSPAAFLESCMLALLAFFMLATRMHERYMFDGFLFCIACVPLARRYLWGSLVLSAVFLANLVYSLQYVNVVTTHPAGVDATNLWGIWTHLFAIAAVGTFFLLGYSYLGGSTEEAAPKQAPARKAAPAGAVPWWRAARDWFDPSEGLSAMRQLDYIVMSLLGAGSFILSFVNYWYPRTKIFDEIYFARAAEEYLRNERIYENTHPPLSKLLITLSTMLFGGLAHGDDSYGWRFLNVVFGALAIMLLYVFAKRVLRSSVFAAIAAALFTFDGMHFVQSRIATPEGFVVVFSLAAVYAFHRFWIAAQVEERPHLVVPPWAFAAGWALSFAAGLAVAGLWKLLWHPLDTASFVITTIYIALGAYLAIRYWAFTALFADGFKERTYPDGSYVLADEATTTLVAPDGGVIESSGGGKPAVKRGEISQSRGNDLVYVQDDLRITYARDGSVQYETPAANASYANNEIHCGDEVEKGSSARFWLVAFTLALGVLVSTKWYGVMGFGVSFCVLIFVWLQRAFAQGRPALWGNPRGFRLDGALVTIVFISATVYALVWVPDLVRQSPDPNEIHNFNDVVYRQYTMYEYHAHLKATHPYASKWWEWPLDYVPIAYFYQDHRANQANPKACCVQEITSFPNPFNMWFGLITVPIVGFLAWKERRKSYALIFITYMLQWLPWSLSPRIDFEYSFYVDIPLICLCNTIVLQRVWQKLRTRENNGPLIANVTVGAAVLAIALCFVYFYPILSAMPITWDAWHNRMWIDKWIVGPG
jgi:dolichyl-phosphate-mannose--protein O-mannosyl transferase/Gpi18-like mannosyltransferase